MVFLTREQTLFFTLEKGKGKRVFQHATEKEEIHTNTGKMKIIKEIQKAGLIVGHTIIAENMTEEAAILLERLLIFRIGRSLFDEGCLTNIVPGGLWHKEASLLSKMKVYQVLKQYKLNTQNLFPSLINFRM